MPNVYDHSRTTSGYARVTVTASTSAVATGEGYAGGTASQSSSDDHTGEVMLPASGRQTYTVGHLGVNSVASAMVRLHRPR
jgi:hypothetical protein